jgi:hypothetical protein
MERGVGELRLVVRDDKEISIDASSNSDVYLLA